MTIDRLAAKIAGLPRKASGRRLYPEALKREIAVALAASGLTHDDFAAKVGVPSSCLSNWKKQAVARAPRQLAPSFKTIAVEPETRVTNLSLRAPGGVVIEGLTVSAVAELLAALTERSSC